MITLAQAKVGMADKVDQNVIDEFRRSSVLLDALEFDDAISPGTGGSTLTYGYVQLQSPSTAGVRNINAEYSADEAVRVEKTTKAIIMGGKFQLDRVIMQTDGAVDELAFQTEQKIKATANEFTNLVINGNSASTGGGVTGTFDGLDKLLTGSATEVTSTVDVSSSSALDSNYNALLDEVDSFISLLAEKPDMLLMNNKMLTKLRAAARRAGYHKAELNEFGKQVDYYNGIVLLDAGKYYNGTNTVDIIPITSKKTDIYAVKIGRNAFHGISPTGSKIIQSYLPDLTEPGAVKDGEVELIAGVALKDSNMAGVLREITIEA